MRNSSASRAPRSFTRPYTSQHATACMTSTSSVLHTTRTVVAPDIYVGAATYSCLMIRSQGMPVVPLAPASAVGCNCSAGAAACRMTQCPAMTASAICRRSRLQSPSHLPASASSSLSTASASRQQRQHRPATHQQHASSMTALVSSARGWSCTGAGGHTCACSWCCLLAAAVFPCLAASKHGDWLHQSASSRVASFVAPCDIGVSMLSSITCRKCLQRLGLASWGQHAAQLQSSTC